jgi:hypothetical protein
MQDLPRSPGPPLREQLITVHRFPDGRPIYEIGEAISAGERCGSL